MYPVRMESPGTHTDTRRGWFEGWALLGVFTTVLLVMTICVLGFNGTGELGVRALIRATARSSLLLFCAAFATTALFYFWPSAASRWMRRNRRSVGLGFAVSHSIHYAAVYAVSRIDPEQFFVEEGRALTDFVTLYTVFMLVAMVALSFDTTQGWVGRRVWQGVHWFMSLGFWLSFASSYGGRALYELYYVPFAGLLLLTMGLRTAAFVAKRRSAAALGV